MNSRRLTSQRFAFPAVNDYEPSDSVLRFGEVDSRNTPRDGGRSVYFNGRYRVRTIIGSKITAWMMIAARADSSEGSLPLAPVI